MLQLIAAALGEASGSPGAITAAWDDITVLNGLGGSRTKSSTVVFTGGGARDLLFEHDIVYGNLKVSVDSGPYIMATTGYTVSVTTGQTVNIKYTCYFLSETATLTVTDDTTSTLLDTIALSFTYEA